SIGRLLSLFGLSVAPEAIIHFVQKSIHGHMADRVSLLLQFGRQYSGALAGPQQRGHGITARGLSNQRFQVALQSRVRFGKRSSSTTRAPNPIPNLLSK